MLSFQFGIIVNERKTITYLCTPTNPTPTRPNTCHYYSQCFSRSSLMPGNYVLSMNWQVECTPGDYVTMKVMMLKKADLQMMNQESGHWNLQHVQLTCHGDHGWLRYAEIKKKLRVFAMLQKVLYCLGKPHSISSIFRLLTIV